MTINTGEILKIEVGEHTYETPPIPDAKEILFYKNKKEDQYWNRSELVKEIPQFFFKWHDGVELDADYTKYEGEELITLSRKDTQELIRLRDREFKRMREGVWFMNNGKPTYLTGNFYGVLMWCAMKGSKNTVERKSTYGQYMRLQRNYCYFIDIIKTTPYARGGDVVKTKKCGITQLQALVILIDAMLNRTSIHRIMSTKEEVAKDSCFSYIAYALEKMPRILTPSIGKQNMGEVYFGEPDPARARFRKNKRTDIEYLNSWITTVPTAKNAFDSLTNNTAWIDEQSKIKEAYPEETHEISIATVMQGLDRHGYLIYTHYVSETNDRSFREARKIYYDSKLKTIDKGSGQTKSKLLCYAITVLDGIFGACDKYGEPMLDEIWKEVNAQHAAMKDSPDKLQAYMRQMPVNEDQCWQETAGEGSIFDNVRLAARRKQLEIDESYGNFSYMDFNFQWSKQPEVDEMKGIYKFNGNPLIIPVSDDQKMEGKPHGLFKWYHKEWTPEHFLHKWLYKTIKDKKGKIAPNPATPFFAVADPTNYALAKDVVTASKNALQIFLMPVGELDALVGKRVTNKRLMVEYLHRPQKPSEFLIHVIQVLMTFGCYILIESNMSWLATRLKEWGFENFLIMVNEDGVLVPYKEYDKQKLFTSQTETIGQYVSAGKQQLGPPDTDMDVDNIEFLDSIDVITQLMQFDPKNTRSYDAGVCYLLGQLGMDHYLGWYRKHQDKLNSQSDGTIAHTLYSILG